MAPERARFVVRCGAVIVLGGLGVDDLGPVRIVGPLAFVEQRSLVSCSGRPRCRRDMRVESYYERLASGHCSYREKNRGFALW